MTIAATELLKTVLELAAEAPDTKARCRYFNDDATPCCIVGQGLAKHGIDRDALKAHGAENFRDWTDMNQWSPVRSPKVQSLFTLDTAEDRIALELLSDIQNKQDKGAPWSVAVDPNVTVQQVANSDEYQVVR